MIIVCEKCKCTWDNGDYLRCPDCDYIKKHKLSLTQMEIKRCEASISYLKHQIDILKGK
jgi:hypothetical protein